MIHLNEYIANDALTKIIEVQKANDGTFLHVFSKQGISLNFGATSYHLDMINLSLAEICPPILQNTTDVKLSLQVGQKTLAISDLSCHSQSVEKLIKKFT